MLKTKPKIRNNTQPQYFDWKTFNQTTKEVHKAIQWIARAGNAYIPHSENDSHTAMEWDIREGYFYGHAFTDNSIRIGFIPTDFTWLILDEDFTVADTLSGLGLSDEKVWGWLQKNLLERGIGTDKLRYDLPYALPWPHAITSTYPLINKKALSFFSELQTRGIKMIKSALLFSGLSGDKGREVWSWPVRFNTCCYIPMKFNGNEEIKKSIEIGMAIQDSMINEYYLYVCYRTQYEKLDHSEFPELPSGGYWLRRDGWNGAVLPISEIMEKGTVQPDMGILFMIAAIESLYEWFAGRR